MHWKILSLVFSSAALLTACRDDSSARVYTVPKEDRSTASAPAQPLMAAEGQMAPPGGQMGGSMADQTLPADVLNQSGILPAWDVPASWQEVPPTSMRMATFEVRTDAGMADIAITSFPGDVGGMLANVNRWRGQLNLPPTSQAEIDRASQNLRTLSGNAVALEFSDGTTSTLVATLRHDGASWFVKMTGPASLVGREAQNFRSFVRSIDFDATHDH